MTKGSVICEGPLLWPRGRPRTNRGDRETGRFRLSLLDSLDDLSRELRALKSPYSRVTSNLELRRNGRPYATQEQPDDPGVSAYFFVRNEEYCMACDKYVGADDNMRAIGLTIAAMRGIERWGSTEMFKQAFSGFSSKQLNPGATGWRSILGRDIRDMTAAKRKFRELAKKHHPDHGGTDEMMRRLNDALEEARRELRT